MATVTKTLNTIEDIDREAVDAIVDDGSFTHGWLKTLEATKFMDLIPYYVTVYSQGKLVAFTPCFYDTANQFFKFNSKGAMHLMKGLLKIHSTLRLGKEHVLLCYSPSCSRSKIFTEKNMDAQALTNELLSEIDSICKRERIMFSSFLFVSEFDQNLSLSLTKMGYHKYFMGTTYYLDIPWCNFEEYVSSLEHGNRTAVKREIRACTENGVTIQEATASKELSNMLAELSSNLFSKYNKTRKNPYDSAFYEALSDNYAKDDARLFIARKNNKNAGFSLLLRHKNTLDAFQTGYDYKQQGKNDFTYFNLVYYAPIRWATQEGVQKIYYRSAADKAKTARGCKPERVYSFLKCHNGYINSQIGNYMKIRSKLGRLKDRHSDHANKP